MLESLTRIARLLAPYGKIFFYSVDPGAYAIMRPIYESQLRTEKESQWIVEGWSRTAIECVHPFMRWSSFIENIDHISVDDCCIVLGSQTNCEATHNAIRFCKAKEIATIFLFDHWVNYLSHFYSPAENSLYLPDNIGVPDEIARQSLIAELSTSWPNERYAEKIHVVGHPAIENSVNAICSLSRNECERIKRRLVPVDKRVVLFLLEPVEDDYGYDNDGIPCLGYTEYSVLSHVLADLDFEDALIIIKPHPRQDIEKIRMFLLPYAHRDILLVENERLEDLIAIADEILGITTVALIIGLKAGKHIISIQVGRNVRGKSLSNHYLEKNIVL